MRTKVKVILDRSGSMRMVQDDVIGSFNQYISDLKNDKEQKYKISLYQFDHEYEVVYEDVKAEEVKPLTKETFIPRGMTALLDAIGKTMSDTKKNSLKDGQKGICVIITDGCENSSREYNNDAVKKLITSLEDDSTWTFVYLGANQDAFDVASGFGFRNNSNVLTYQANAAGVASSYANLSQATMTRARQTAIKGMSNTLDFFEDGDDNKMA